MADNRRGSGFKGLLAGLGLGIGIGLLIAPESGKKTRAKLKKKFNELKEDVENLTAEDVKFIVTEKIEDIRNAITDFDKEEALDSAKEKAEIVKEKIANLIDYTKKEKLPEIGEKVEKISDDFTKSTKVKAEKLVKKN